MDGIIRGATGIVRLRSGLGILLCGALAACALLRSAPLPRDEWTFVAFPGQPAADSARLAALAAGNRIAVACASPDTVTFAVESRCGDLDRSVSDHELLLVNNWSGAGYRADILRAAMAQPEGRHRLAGQAVALAETAGFRGILLDFHGLGPRDVNSLVALVSAIGDSARARGISPVGIVVPVADTAAYPGRHLGALTSFLALRLELEPATPGPSAPRDRMARLVGARAAEIGAHRIVLLIPADGYLWRAGEPGARVSFADAVATARDWGVELGRDESSGTLRARAPGRGEIWINDAALINDLVRDARRLGIRRFALYGLGGEDPAIWTTVAAGATVTR